MTRTLAYEPAGRNAHDQNRQAGSATEASNSDLAWSTAARIAPRRTGQPWTAVGTTIGLAGQNRPTSEATRLASAVPPASPTSPPSTTRPGSRTTEIAATPVATRAGIQSSGPR